MSEQRGPRAATAEDERERLLDATVAVASREGFRSTRLGAILGRAGLGEERFSEQFADVDAALVAALEHAHRQMHRELARAVIEAPAERALAACVSALVQFAADTPEMARMVMGEAMGGGGQMQQLREEAIATAGGLVERAYEPLASGTLVPDIPAGPVIGGVYRLLDSMLRRSEPLRTDAARNLVVWLDGYARPLSAHRWRSGAPVSPAPQLAPAPTLRGAAEGSTGAEALDSAAQRRLIVLAAAELAAREGYEGVTVERICAAAGVDAAIFDSHFPDRAAAFRASHELHYQQAMMSAAGAFFSGASWPEKVWLAGGAFASYMQANPVLARATFVEGYAGGPPTLQRGEDIVGAFTVFLQEGHQLLDGRDPPSRLALAAIGASIFEMGYAGARVPFEPQFAGLQPSAVYMCLAPFLGADAADQFVASQLGQEK